MITVDPNARYIQPRRDHLGQEFGSFELMCRAWGQDSHLVLQRLKRNWDLERALTEPSRRNSGKSVATEDHLGHKFQQQNDMARCWGHTWDTVKRRLDSNWTLKKALETPSNTRMNPVHDQNGTMIGYGTQQQARNAGIGPQQLNRKLQAGVPAIDLHKNRTMTESIDHLGHVFEQKKAMCDYYDITVGAFSSRIKQHWSLEEALTKPVVQFEGNRGNRVAVEGKIYNSIQDACAAYGIQYNTYYKRLKMQFTPQEALMLGRLGIEKPCKDHFGNPYPQMKQMCMRYHINVRAFLGRIQTGWSLANALEKPMFR